MLIRVKSFVLESFCLFVYLRFAWLCVCLWIGGGYYGDNQEIGKEVCRIEKKNAKDKEEKNSIRK